MDRRQSQIAGGESAAVYLIVRFLGTKQKGHRTSVLLDWLVLRAKKMNNHEHAEDEEFEQYAEAIRDLRVSHESGHAVIAENLGYELRHMSVDAVIVSPEGAVGGWVDINFERLSLNDPYFDERLQEIATILMGGKAAEEMTHPHLADESHWKNDISDFKDRVKVARTDEEMDVILEVGHHRAAQLLNSLGLREEHKRLCNFFANQPTLKHPNGRFLWRVMKGLSS
jgi:hypothetical protein